MSMARPAGTTLSFAPWESVEETRSLVRTFTLAPWRRSVTLNDPSGPLARAVPVARTLPAFVRSVTLTFCRGFAAPDTTDRPTFAAR
jgi:hypothetical protein